MKRFANVLAVGVSLLAGLFIVQGFVSDVEAAKKPKGIIIPEGDNATLVTEGSYITITFPEVLSEDDRALYDIDLLGYMLRINGKISSDGNSYNGSPIYYYVHNSNEWLHKGQYELPTQISVSRIKMIKMSKSILRLRDFNKQMPLLDGSKEKKNDSGYQDELMFGENRYIFMEISMRD